MNENAFFTAIRPAFGGRIGDRTVKGIQALLKAGKDLSIDHMAYVLANVRHEVGPDMYPIKETVLPYHKDKNPTDDVVIARLDRAFKAGELKGVKKKYWQNGEFGRGMIQLTHEKNRLKFGITNRDDLLELDVSARVAVQGMRDGLFTGKKLSDYKFPSDANNPPNSNPRRIVNGQDGSDEDVAGYYAVFAAALRKGEWGQPASVINVPTVLVPTKPTTKPATKSFWSYLLGLLKG
ncbi:MAG: hypothetical protein U5K75_12070 [Ahrensia sp.]|nr:hypothetical protein [Ahrensia sp.]